jgi:hypothetical protein
MSVEAAYAAGLFDGEGHIAITFRSNGKGKARYPRYQLYCSMSQNNREAIEWLVSIFGGSSRFVVGKRSYNRRYYERWNWVISTANAAAFLETIRPYMIVKKQEIEIALAFQATMDKHRFRIPAEVVDFRRECHQRIRDIRGSKAS